MKTWLCISVRACMPLFLAMVLPVLLTAQQSVTQKRKSEGSNTKYSAPPQKHKPPVQASMVGYIDDAIIGSQVRVRADAAFGDTQPDLAEFFQAAAGYDAALGLGPAAGPGPGLAIKENFQQLYMRGEYAPINHFSFVAEVPIRWVQPVQFLAGTTPSTGGWGNQGGLSDVSAGFKAAAQQSEKDSVTFQFMATFPSGDAGKALGTDHYAISPAVLYFQKLSDNFSVESEIEDSHPISGDHAGFTGDVLEYGGGPSYMIRMSEAVTFAPVIEFVGWRVFGGKWSDPEDLADKPPYLDTADASNILNLKGGFRTSIGNNTSIYTGYGHVLTNANLWYRQIFRVEFRRTF